MKLLKTSIKYSLFFYLGLFLFQVALFSIAPPFYVASPNQTNIPSFIKWSFGKYFGLVALLYGGWAFCSALTTCLFLKIFKVQIPEGKRGGVTLLFCMAAQFFAVFLTVTFFYPSALVTWPVVSQCPLGILYLGFFAASLAFFVSALAIQQGAWWRRILANALPPTLAILATLGLMQPAPLHLPQATPNQGGSLANMILLGFDALDGDTGGQVLEPHLRQWGGRLFSNAFTPLPLTHPAWNSILSGLYPQHHGVRYFFDSPQASLYPELFLPKRLKQEAQFSTLFASDQPETSYFTEADGFDHSVFSKIGWDAHLSAMVLNHFILPAVWLNNSLAEKLLGRTLNTPSIFNYDLARFFNYSFQEFAKLGKGPKFLALHSCFLHSPIRLNHRELAGVPGYLKLSPLEFSFWKWPKPGKTKVPTPKGWINPYFVRREKLLLFLTQLLGQLQDQGYLKTDLVVLLSDHGERFAENYEVYGGIHGVDLKTRQQNNVMLAFLGPSFKDFKKILDPVSLIDLTPTLLSQVGLVTEGLPYDGMPLLNKEGNPTDLPPRSILAESMGYINDPADREKFPQISVQSLEESLSYQKNGKVTVGPDYYQRIIQKKEFADFAKQPSMLANSPAALAPIAGTAL